VLGLAARNVISGAVFGGSRLGRGPAVFRRSAVRRCRYRTGGASDDYDVRGGG